MNDLKIQLDEIEKKSGKSILSINNEKKEEGFNVDENIEMVELE